MNNVFIGLEHETLIGEFSLTHNLIKKIEKLTDENN